jgi:diacylglycerol kinase (ATP)
MKSLVVLISNPAAKRTSGRKIDRACRFLKVRGWEVEKLSTRQKGDAEILTRNAIEKSPALVIAAGGDGTFNEVINGLAGSEIPMGILPLGTTNVLAKELGIPENVEGAIEAAVDRAPKVISLGKIIFTRDSLPVARLFCLMAGIGYDGEAVFGTNEGLKKISGKGAYIYSGIKTLLRFSPAELTFNVAGKKYSGYSAVIGKAGKYGGNFKVVPDARITDPVLYACIFKGKRRLDVLRYVFGVAMGTHLGYRDIEYLKTENVEIYGGAHVQVDGDYLGKTPAKIEIVRDALRLVF